VDSRCEIFLRRTQQKNCKKYLDNGKLGVDVRQKTKKQALAKRKTDLENMQERLLTGFLSGSIEEPVFHAKSAQLKDELSGIEESIEEANGYDTGAPERAMAVFDFSQNLVELWHGSNFEGKRDILDCVSLNRTVTDLTLYVVKRTPFDFLAERRFLEDGRGDCPYFVPSKDVVMSMVSAFMEVPATHILMARNVLQNPSATAIAS